MIVVLDTNVLVAAFAARGLCQSVLELCIDRHTIAVSDHLMNELTRSLKTKLRLPEATATGIEEFLRSVSQAFVSGLPEAPVCRDPDDDRVLTLADTANARMLVTGDRDLLDLESYRGVDIVNPRTFWDHHRSVES